MNSVLKPMIGASLRRILLGCLAGMYVAYPFTASAVTAPGQLAKVPLFLRQAVQPNVMIALDNSGSMGREYIPDGISPTNQRVCINKLAYNPKVKYTPWKGKDSNGDDFADADPAAARDYAWAADGTFANLSEGWKWAKWDPSREIRQHPSNNRWQAREPGDSWHYFSYFIGGNVVPVIENGAPVFRRNGHEVKVRPANGFRYRPWNDSNGNGIAESGECSGSAISINTLPLTNNNPSDPSYPNSLQNYANWYSYYRSRSMVVNKAVSEVLWKSKARVGLSALRLGPRWLPNGDIGTGHIGVEVKDIDNLTPDDTGNINPVADVNKHQLLQTLFQFATDGNTPLRQTLDNVGRYFQGVEQTGAKGLFGSSNKEPDPPLLPAEEGGECQQNFALLFSDGYRNGNFYSGPAARIGNADMASPYGGGTFGGSNFVTLGDIAMYYYSQDFSTSLANRVPLRENLDSDRTVNADTGRKDDNPAQHMVTYTISFGLSGGVDPNIQPASVTGSFNWAAGGGVISNDMYHAAWNGRGKFLSAQNPNQLIEALKKVFRDINDRTSAAAAAVAVNSTSVQSGGLLFQGGFSSGNWSGSFSAYELAADGTLTKQWDAAQLLNGRNLATHPRVVLTYNQDSGQGVVFQAPADIDAPSPSEIDAGMVADLRADAPAGAEQDHVERLVAYLKGGHDDEASNSGSFRSRDGKRLGDIVHSSPVFVGKPLSWVEAPGSERRHVVYVGSNDGMLHAFDAARLASDGGGRELFAYVPRLLSSSANRLGLHWLADGDYEHRYYVDQTPAVGDAKFRRPDESNPSFHTILVGGLGAGAQGLYALDITDPDELASGDPATVASRVLWEIHPNGMGFVFGSPTIARFGFDSDNDPNTPAEAKWYVVAPNGYNNTYDGRAKIFVIDPADGSVVSTLDTGNSIDVVNGNCAAPGSDCNGMSAPTVVDADGDGFADHIYAGDVKGNLWVFETTGPVSSWSNASKRRKLFAATKTVSVNGTNTELPLPITAPPVVAKHPFKRGLATEPNVLVGFSTGQLVADGDESDPTKNTMFMVWDDGQVGHSAPYGRADLVAQQLVKVTTSGGVDVRLVDDPKEVDYVHKKGWYIEYLEQGERGITTPRLFGSLLVWTTMTPKAATPGANICDAAGSSWLMAVDLATGQNPAFVALDVNGDHDFNQDDLYDSRTVVGVHSANIYWQPTIVTGGDGSGRALLPVDTENPGGTIEQRSIQGISRKGMRSAWGHYNF